MHGASNEPNGSLTAQEGMEVAGGDVTSHWLVHG